MSQPVQDQEISSTSAPFNQTSYLNIPVNEDQPTQDNFVSSTISLHSRDAIAAMERLVGADYLSDEENLL